MITPIAIDFETSAIDAYADVHNGGLPAAPIQIGIYVPHADFRFGQLIGKWNWKEYEWNEVSAGIHGITKEELEKAEPAWKVDIRATAALLDLAPGNMFTMSLGWNVAGFDRRYIARHMPNLDNFLSYRSIDLNSGLLHIVSSEKEYEELKRAAKESAAEVMKARASAKKESEEENWHDALYDAEASWWAFQYLRERLSFNLNPVGVL